MIARHNARADAASASAAAASYATLLASTDQGSVPQLSSLALQAVARRDAAIAAAALDRELAIEVPIGILLAFFAGRWALTNRLTPVWPLRAPPTAAEP